jgi:CO/xanthine dehydrogenase Mo-binding subunit
MGNAVVAACRDLLYQLRTMAREAGIAEESEDVEFADGSLRAGHKTLSYPELLRQSLGPNQGEIVGTGTFKGKREPKHALGGLTDFWELVFTAAEVKVDSATGKVSVIKLANVTDCGIAINPLQAEAQEEGGLIMGLGHSVMEELLYDANGRPRNAGPLDYRIATAMDIPVDIETHLLENQDGPGPFGAKGIGEGGAIAVAAAVAGAVSDATGIVINDLPFTAEKVWRSLQRQDQH